MKIKVTDGYLKSSTGPKSALELVLLPKVSIFDWKFCNVIIRDSDNQSR